MSLDAALSIAFSSLRVTESQLATSSANVTNASKAGYTTKTYDVSYVTYGDITTPSGGITVGSIDYSLYKSIISDAAEAGYYTVLSDGLDSISTAIGTVDGESSLSSTYTTLQSTLEALETSPDDASQKQNVVVAAEEIASELNDLSDAIQSERLNANKSIETTVGTINSLLNDLQRLNEEIQTLTNLGQSTANLEDERMVALEALSEQIGIDYFFNSNNTLQVYTESGAPLLTTSVHELSYTATSYVTDETLYPGGFDAITLDGVDITTSIDGGKLAGYVELRDKTLVETQEVLDEIATTIMDTVNTVLSTGTSYPAPSTLTGDTSFSATDSFSATGTVRIAITSSDGTVQSYTDLDISTFSTISDVVSAIDSLPGISASLDSNGQLVMTSDDNNYGVSLNQMDSSVGPDSQSFSSYFGINTLFSGDSASDIHVNEALVNDYTQLATGILSDSATLAVGDIGITSGDVEAISNLTNALSSSVSFSAAGSMSAQTTTIGNYVSNFLSDISNQANTFAERADTAIELYEATKSAMENSTGVNIDEETIKITEYQNQYEAAAAIVSTIQNLFQTLLEAVK